MTEICSKSADNSLKRLILSINMRRFFVDIFFFRRKAVGDFGIRIIFAIKIK
jgi:hypothetical protein